MEPYVIWFGDFKDQSVEKIMFDPKGYFYLRDFVLGKLKTDPSKARLIKRVQAVMDRAEQLPIVAKCDCGRPAGFVACTGDESGVGFDRFCCRDCCVQRGREEFIPLRFSSLRKFGVQIDQKLFLSQLRQACGLSGRLTVEKAVEFFFPDAEPTSPPLTAPSQSVLSKKDARKGPLLPF